MNTVYFTQIKQLIEYVDNNEIPKDITICLMSREQMKDPLDYTVPCNFTWNGLHGTVNNCHILPRRVYGKLIIEDIYVNNMSGMPFEVGGLSFNNFTNVMSWKGFQETVIHSNKANIILPVIHDFEFHPFFSKHVDYLRLVNNNALTSIQKKIFEDKLFSLLNKRQHYETITEGLLDLFNSNNTSSFLVQI